MGVCAGLYLYDVVVKSSRSLSRLLMSSCYFLGKSRGIGHCYCVDEYTQRLRRIRSVWLHPFKDMSRLQVIGT